MNLGERMALMEGKLKYIEKLLYGIAVMLAAQLGLDYVPIVI